MRSDIQPGDKVDVTRLGMTVRSVGQNSVVATDPAGIDHYYVEDGTVRYSNVRRPEPVRPAHWPPQLGDLWADGDGNEFFIWKDDGRLHGRGTGPAMDIDVMWDNGKRLSAGRLLHRKGDRPDGKRHRRPGYCPACVKPLCVFDEG